MSGFEKWFKTTEAYKMLEEQNYFKMDLFFFVGARNQYRHSGVQVAYLTWQHQQAIIDSLKTQLNNMEQCYIQKKKQVKACAALVGEWREKPMGGWSDYARGGLHSRQDCADDLEKAMRGEHE